MRTKSDWQGNASELLDKMNDNTKRSRVRYVDWPKSPIQLSNELSRISPFLREKGIVVSRKHSGKRLIVITNENPAEEPNMVDMLTTEAVESADNKVPVSSDDLFGLAFEGI